MKELAMALVLAGALARAAGADVRQADALFAEGRALLEQNDAAGACEKFNAAVVLDPTAPGIILNLGLCYERLGRYATSLVWFRRAQALAAEQHLPPDYKAAAETYTVELAAKVALARLDVSGAPGGVEIKIDGRLVGPADYGRLEVDPGSILEATAAGYRPFRRQLAPDGRDAGTIAIVLERDPRGRRTKIIGASLAGGGVLTIAGGFLYAYRIQQSYEKSVRERPAGVDLAELRREAESDLRYKATTVVGIGLALVATGAIVYLTAPSMSSEVRTTALAPVLGPDFAGLAASGSF